MARNLLNARAVQTAKAGTHYDGDGLELNVKELSDGCGSTETAELEGRLVALEENHAEATD